MDSDLRSLRACTAASLTVGMWSVVVGVSSSGRARVRDARNKRLLSVKRMLKCAVLLAGRWEEKRFQRWLDTD